METVTRSYTLPLFMLYKLTDKLTGSALAPYYFCKYFISSHDVLESYLEMLKFCTLSDTVLQRVVTSAFVTTLWLSRRDQLLQSS